MARLQDQLTAFAATHGLEQVIVVYVASTEPPVDIRQLPERWSDLRRTLDDPQTCPLRSSVLYSIAAPELGYPYLNFTPSLGSTPPAIDELARQREQGRGRVARRRAARRGKGRQQGRPRDMPGSCLTSQDARAGATSRTAAFQARLRQDGHGCSRSLGCGRRPRQAVAVRRGVDAT